MTEESDTWRPQLSIVICSHRRCDALAGCLASLAVQASSCTSVEIVVVDNDRRPSAEVEAIVARSARVLKAKYLYESRLGLSHARNTGGRAAQADYIAYLDDDVRVPPGFVACLLRCLAEQQPDVMGGPYYPFYLEIPPLWLPASQGCCSAGQRKRLLGDTEFLAGGNIVFARHVLDEAGWFDPKYGMHGRRMWYGEETAVQMIARRRNPGLRVYYDPDVYVYHLVPKRKMSVVFHLRSAYRLGRSQAYLWLGQSSQGSEWARAPVRIMVAMLSFLADASVGIWRRDRHQYPLWQHYVCDKPARHFRVLGRNVTVMVDAMRGGDAGKRSIDDA